MGPSWAWLFLEWLLAEALNAESLLLSSGWPRGCRPGARRAELPEACGREHPLGGPLCGGARDVSCPVGVGVGGLFSGASLLHFGAVLGSAGCGTASLAPTPSVPEATDVPRRGPVSPGGRIVQVRPLFGSICSLRPGSQCVHAAHFRGLGRVSQGCLDACTVGCEAGGCSA